MVDLMPENNAFHRWKVKQQKTENQREQNLVIKAGRNLSYKIDVQ